MVMANTDKNVPVYNTKTARLILRKKLTLRDTNTTETDKVGLQPVDSCFALLGARQHGDERLTKLRISQDIDYVRMTNTECNMTIFGQFYNLLNN